jgi:hypothetical protein
MIQLPLIEKVLGYVWKGVTYFWNRKGARLAAQQAALLEQQEQQVLNLLRTSTYANSGNCVKPPMGSPEESFLRRMVAKGLLAESFGGFMLPQTIRQIDYAYPHAYF